MIHDGKKSVLRGLCFIICYALLSFGFLEIKLFFFGIRTTRKSDMNTRDLHEPIFSDKCGSRESLCGISPYVSIWYVNSPSWTLLIVTWWSVWYEPWMLQYFYCFLIIIRILGILPCIHEGALYICAPVSLLERERVSAPESSPEQKCPWIFTKSQVNCNVFKKENFEYKKIHLLPQSSWSSAIVSTMFIWMCKLGLHQLLSKSRAVSDGC